MANHQSGQGRGAIVVVGSPKGGVGKSAVAWEIAQGFARAGARTVLIDGDETATVATKYDNRQVGPHKEAEGAGVVIAPHNVERTVLDMAKNVDLVVVDLGARDWDRYNTLPTSADLWLIPTDFASDNMVPAANLFADQLWPKRKRHMSERYLPVRLVWSKTPTHAAANASGLQKSLAWWSETIKGITALEPGDGERFHPDTGFDALNTQLRHRSTPWEYATTYGAALEELPARVAGGSAAEVSELVSEVNAILQAKG